MSEKCFSVIYIMRNDLFRKYGIEKLDLKREEWV